VVSITTSSQPSIFVGAVRRDPWRRPRATSRASSIRLVTSCHVGPKSFSEARRRRCVSLLYRSLSGTIFCRAARVSLIVVNFSLGSIPSLLFARYPRPRRNRLVLFLDPHHPERTGTHRHHHVAWGFATANSILVVSFASEQMAAGKDPITAAA